MANLAVFWPVLLRDERNRTGLDSQKQSGKTAAFGLDDELWDTSAADELISVSSWIHQRQSGCWMFDSSREV